MKELGGTMNLDSLIERIEASSDEMAALGLPKLLLDWKSDSSSVEELRKTVDLYLCREHSSEAVQGFWSSFCEQAIRPIGGMTMNERLYWFGLFDPFDACASDEERVKFYRKLLANP